MNRQLLVVACLVAIVAVSATTESSNDITKSPMFSSAMAEIDAQVNSALLKEEPKKDEKKDEKKEEKKEEKKPSPELNKEMKNMLDLKTLTVKLEPGKPSKQNAHVISAFVAIAHEAEMRGYHAMNVVQHAIAHNKHALSVQQHDMEAWINNNYHAAKAHIEGEKQRIGRMTDEITHLQHIYRDAVAKNTAYKKQMQNLISERQLQTTPPLLPAVQAATVSEKEYKDSLAKLEHYRKASEQIMTQTARAITAREHLIELGNKWVKQATAQLKAWLGKQKLLAAKRVEVGKRSIQAAETRYNNLKVIAGDAAARHKEYLGALHVAHIESRIAALQKQKKAYESQKQGDAGDKARMDQFVKSMELEIAALEAKIKTLGASSKVVPPPAAWGILAGFNPPVLHALPYPHQAFGPLATPPKGMSAPSLGSNAPAAPEAAEGAAAAEGGDDMRFKQKYHPPAMPKFPEPPSAETMQRLI